jgi:hypothetical protein
MSILQELNLSGGSEINIDPVFMFQPRMVDDSDMPFIEGFDRERQSSRLTGSVGEIGRNIVWIARAMAFVPHSLLLSISGTMVIPSSM